MGLNLVGNCDQSAILSVYQYSSYLMTPRYNKGAIFYEGKIFWILVLPLFFLKNFGSYLY